MRVKPLVWILTVGILAVPRPSHAGLLDVIWEMSGPQLIGFGLNCELGVTGPPVNPQCSWFGMRRGWDTRADRPYWAIVEARIYVSTGRNGDDDGQEVDFKWGRIGMLGLDPMIARRWSARGGRLYSAAGLSLNRFLGGDFEDFSNYAIKLRPVGYDRAFSVGGHRLTLGAAYNLRFYPNGFDATPSGSFESIGDSEWVQGVLFGVTF